MMTRLMHCIVVMMIDLCAYRYEDGQAKQHPKEYQSQGMRQKQVDQRRWEPKQQRRHAPNPSGRSHANGQGHEWWWWRCS